MKSKRPYELPVPLVCDAGKVKNGVSMKIVDDYIEKHRAGLSRYTYLEQLYRGFFDIDREPAKEEWKPDNRLTVPFPKYITDTFTGYGYGIPIKEEHPDVYQQYATVSEYRVFRTKQIKKNKGA